MTIPSAEQTFALFVRSVRTELEMSQAALAEHLGISQAKLSKIESGQADMFRAEYEKLLFLVSSRCPFVASDYPELSAANLIPNRIS